MQRLLAEAISRLEKAVQETVNPGDDGPFEDGEVPLVDAARDVISAARNPADPIEVLDEIGRLALCVSKEEVERYAEAGGMKPAETFVCTGGKTVPKGRRCPHCGARTTGEECRL